MHPPHCARPFASALLALAAFSAAAADTPPNADEKKPETPILDSAGIEALRAIREDIRAIREYLTETRRPPAPEGAARRNIRENREGVSEDRRPQFQAEMRQRVRNMLASREQEMDKRVDGYFNLETQEERNAYLDNVIDEMRTRMAGRRPDGAPPRGRGPNADANRPPRQPAAEGQSADDSPQANADSRPPRQPPSEARQNARIRERLDSSSPEQQARRQQFREALRERMQERGITPQRGGAPGGRGARGGGDRGGQ